MVRTVTRVLVAAIVGCLVVVPTAPAAARLSPTPDKTWMANGIVYSEVASGNVIYIGGAFSRVSACRPDLSCPKKTLRTLNVAALNARTGEAIPTFKVKVRGPEATVYALAVLGHDLFLGGQFATVDRSPRRNLAAIDLTTGALDPNVNAQVGIDNSDRIRSMVATPTRVYVAGAFAQIDGHTRKHLAAFRTDGSLDPAWTPSTDGSTHTLALNCYDTKVIAGGGFREAAGSGGTLQGRLSLAIFNATSGALDPWMPPTDLIERAPPYDMAATCSRLFVGSGDRNRIFAVDLTSDTGTLLWMLTADGNAQAVAVWGDRLLVGGHFSVMPQLSTGENVERTHFAVLDLDGNLKSGWVPAFRGRIHTGVWDILVKGRHIWVAGGFTSVSGTQRWCIARFTDAS